MCLLVFALNVHPDYSLVFAGNRDEAYDRETRHAHWWADPPDVLGGRDLQAGGSWLGITRSGRFAVVTNYRDGREPARTARSRGLLVSDFLSSPKPLSQFTEQLAATAEDYSGYSLLYGHASELRYFSNRGDSNGILPAGTHGLSNHLINTPWPKVERTRRTLAAQLQHGPIEAQLLEMLADRTLAGDEELPDSGVGREMEKLLSAPFIVGDRYGTRASTVITMHHNGKVHFVERNVDHEGQETDIKRFEFELE